MPRFPVLALALLAGALGACESKVAGGSADGATVFASACASCHGASGAPPEAMRAQLGVRDLTGAEWKARASRALVIEQVRHGSKNKLMPSFTGALSDPQIEAVADFVMAMPAAK
jgi:mono/diheme cytochrome c family protein